MLCGLSPEAAHYATAVVDHYAGLHRHDLLAGFLTSVFRRVLANLLLDVTNPKFRTLREGNAAILKCLTELGEIDVASFTPTQSGGAEVVGRARLHVSLTIFHWIGMHRASALLSMGNPSSDSVIVQLRTRRREGDDEELTHEGRDEIPPIGEDTLVFHRTVQSPSATPLPVAIMSDEKASLRRGDALLSLMEARLLEHHTRKGERTVIDVGVPGKRRQEALRAQEAHRQHLRREQMLDATVRRQSTSEETTARSDAAVSLSRMLFHPDDFEEVRGLVEATQRTLHFTGRLRNYSFEARHYTLRRMAHGRVFACASPTQEACGNELLEAHWHVINGNILYGYVAHFTAAGDSVVHIGPEYGFQYNAMPGTPHFGKTILFSVKQIDPSTGVVSRLEHPNKPVETCVFCDRPFSSLFL
jgi:hypothetical protein